MNCPALPDAPATLVRYRLRQRALIAAALSAGLGLSSVWAQPAEPAPDMPGWTGALQDPAVARKEAAAALAEGRRECNRQARDRAACLKKVQSDHEAMLKRLRSADAAPAKRTR